uniref:Uncharacterized protein n=1 Tax=Myripristis murdjan TaxID=586833 RepID=A0A667WNC5_9TELE
TIMYLKHHYLLTKIMLRTQGDSLIAEFGQVSDYKLNLTKSDLFPINDKACQLSFQHFPFEVSKDSFIYLGVCVIRKYKDLLPKNLSALIKAKQDMERC